MDVTHKDKDVPLGEVGEEHEGEDDGKPNCDSHLDDKDTGGSHLGQSSLYFSLDIKILIVNYFNFEGILCRRLDHLGGYEPPGSLGGQRRAFRPGFRSS